MGLDFHRLYNNEFLFRLDDQQFGYLEEIFKTFSQWTGLVIDQYADFQLSVENQGTLVKIISKYVDVNDLNRDKHSVTAILEFKGLLKFFISQQADLRIMGD